MYSAVCCSWLQYNAGVVRIDCPFIGYCILPILLVLSVLTHSLIHSLKLLTTNYSTSASSSPSSSSLFAKPKRKNPTPKTVTGAEDMPVNLKRKVQAKRPPLGHVVPTYMRTKGTGGSANPKLRPQGKARDAGLNNPSRLKILGGVGKGRRLDSPQVYLRPMMGKVKEAVYSTFTSLGLYQPGKLTRHLDIFSGSGSVGLESLSRGATHCTFVDLSDDCATTVQRNLDWCGFGSGNPTGSGSDDFSSYHDTTSQVVCADAITALRDPASVGIDPLVPFQIVTLCPPYEEIVYADLLDAVANSPVIGDDTVVLVEYPVELLHTIPHVIARNTNPDSAGALIGIRNRKYGRTVIALYVCNPTGNLDGADSRPEEFV